MDIYFGSNQAIEQTTVSKFNQLTNTIDFEEVAYQNDKFILLKRKNSESIFITNDIFECVFDGYLTGIKEKNLIKSVEKLANILIKKEKVNFNEFNGLFILGTNRFCANVNI